MKISGFLIYIPTYFRDPYWKFTWTSEISGDKEFIFFKVNEIPLNGDDIERLNELLLNDNNVRHSNVELEFEEDIFDCSKVIYVKLLE